MDEIEQIERIDPYLRQTSKFKQSQRPSHLQRDHGQGREEFDFSKPLKF